MEVNHKATKINLFNFSTPQMRAFHMSWFAFFLCFFAWFGIAPLMAVVREELSLTKAQIGNTIIASVAITIVARLFIGWLCDRIGPRITYTWLLVLGALPVMGIGFAQSYETFLLFRLGIGYVCFELCWHGERHVGRLGQPGGRCDPIGHAPGFQHLAGLGTR